MFGYYELMLETYSAHKNLKQKLSDWRNGKLKKDKKVKGNVEPESVTKARNEFSHKLDILFNLKIEPLEKKFRENPHSAIAELIEFLSVDIPAFRCGYAKGIFLQLLKNVELTTDEITQLQQVALKTCEAENVRREFRRWCRLMIKLADGDFVLKLKNLNKSENLFTQLKAKWMLVLIGKHRTDL